MGIHEIWSGDWEAALVLEDGRVFRGRPFGAVERLCSGCGGEVVFATSMTGYQEICTDPSYRGQMVVLTYPIIGNYGITPEDTESTRPWLSALLVREICDEYSHWRATGTLDAFLAHHGIPGLCDIDTRALTRHLRTHGTLRGIIQAYRADEEPDLAALTAAACGIPGISQLDVVAEVSSPTPQAWKDQPMQPDAPRVLVVDTGFKHGIARSLAARGLAVVVAPYTVDMAGIRRLRPDGVVLANGPGDPAGLAHLVEVARALIRARIPLMGICLGHQIIAQAVGATTSRLPFGHHGANHPVRDVETGKITLTSQNHNFQVDAATIPQHSGFFVSHVNLLDGSVEGLTHQYLPILSVQFHPEASPGPEENREFFDRFALLIARTRATELTG
jgi:carbamoyl-phosphate synthase small subunit